MLRNAIESITEEELLAITLEEDTSPASVVTTCISSCISSLGLHTIYDLKV